MPPPLAVAVVLALGPIGLELDHSVLELAQWTFLRHPRQVDFGERLDGGNRAGERQAAAAGSSPPRLCFEFHST